MYDSCFPVVASTVSDSAPSFVFVCPLTAIQGELQPQLLVLELLQEDHDRVLVDAGLPPARHQQDAHHVLLHPSDQFRRPHGARGRQGRPLLLFPLLLPLNGPIYQKCAIYQMQLRGMKTH